MCCSFMYVLAIYNVVCVCVCLNVCIVSRWVWNGPRQPYLKREKEYRNWKNDRTRGEYIPTDMTEDDLAADKAERDKAVKGLFRNIDLPPVEIYWQNHVSNIHD